MHCLGVSGILDKELKLELVARSGTSILLGMRGGLGLGNTCGDIIWCETAAALATDAALR